MPELTYVVFQMLDAIRLEIRAASHRAAGDHQSATALEFEAQQARNTARPAGENPLNWKESHD